MKILKNGSLHLYVALLLTSIALIVTSTSALADRFGYWNVNGIGLYASLQYTWVQPLSLKIKGRSYAQPPTGQLHTIYVGADAQDRCNSAEPWVSYAFASVTKNNSNETGYVQKTGQYQDCSQWDNHKYKNLGTHFYYWPGAPGGGLNEWKYLTEIFP
jgi:hypothetical protein